jgi:hypothetical protein
MKNTQILACASLLAVTGYGAAAKATPVISDSQTKTDLKAAICEQDWQKAIAFSSRLMASSTITPEHRQELVTWRHRFSQYAAGGTYFDHIPNCEGFATYQGPKPSETAAAQAAAAATAAQAARAQAEQIKADLKTAICLQDWQGAVALSSQLMASNTITADHRQELVKWRYQFTQYAASGTVFTEIPNCGYNSSSIPKAHSSRADSLPLSTPVAAPRAQPATIARPQTTAAPNATCYVTYSDGRTVNLEHLCGG